VCDSHMCVCDSHMCVCDSHMCVCDSHMCVCDSHMCVCITHWFHGTGVCRVPESLVCSTALVCCTAWCHVYLCEYTHDCSVSYGSLWIYTRLSTTPKSFYKTQNLFYCSVSCVSLWIYSRHHCMQYNTQDFLQHTRLSTTHTFFYNTHDFLEHTRLSTTRTTFCNTHDFLEHKRLSLLQCVGGLSIFTEIDTTHRSCSTAVGRVYLCEYTQGTTACSTTHKTFHNTHDFLEHTRLSTTHTFFYTTQVLLYCMVLCVSLWIYSHTLHTCARASTAIGMQNQ